MKSFFKQYSYNMIKNLINQFAISIFGALLSMVTFVSQKTGTVWSVIVSLFSIAFYLFLIYTTTWEIGAKDRISVDVGKKKYKPLTGLWISLFSHIPVLLFSLIFIIMDLLLLIPFFKAPQLQFVIFIKNALNAVGTVAKLITDIGLNGMYLGITMTVNLPSGANLVQTWWIYFVIIIPAIVTSWVAYYTGFKNFRMIAPLFDKMNNKNKKR